MFLHTKHVESRPGYRLYVEFNTGEVGEIDLSNELWGEMFEPLKDATLFASARHDPVMETVVWANGADMAPEYLHKLLTTQAAKAA
ncbi:MAG: DUF2442 domain-containing protein [Gammaproteobacteria bacterium]|nr:DUF2442 domain-containing protein [Gammaproteobacteria bacterium]MBU1653254.1 DUF2442 domain-containing protein [Gammaproteobacteria bacterium]MBU1962111.1 DUF2442 domain-containing protein [Gammaproteobacteria bacterium]